MLSTRACLLSCGLAVVTLGLPSRDTEFESEQYYVSVLGELDYFLMLLRPTQSHKLDRKYKYQLLLGFTPLLVGYAPCEPSDFQKDYLVR